MRKLKYAEVAPVRSKLLVEQGGKCALCQQPIAKGKEVLDHCHKEGFIRGVLHASCNSLLGKLENSRARFGLGNDLAFAAFLRGVVPYLHASSGKYDILHPTFKTAEQKRLARNAAARKRRAKDAGTTKK